MSIKAGCVALLVEDEWLIRLELADALASAGLTVLEAGAGEEALAYLEADQRLDILITDVRLEGKMTGWEVAETIRSVRPNIGVIYASANPPVEERQVPGSIFLAKPTSMRQLLQACSRFCNDIYGG